MVVVLFYYTARDETELLDTSEPADVTVNVVGKQWSWDFNYVEDEVHEVGTQAIMTGEPGAVETIPTLYLPVGERIEFVLTARDVIHSFWVPVFLQKMDMIPGRINRFQIVPTQEGTFAGKCAELCGTYHSQMLFNVKVVPRSEYEQHVAELRAAGQTGLLNNTLNRTELDGRPRRVTVDRRELSMSAATDIDDAADHDVRRRAHTQAAAPGSTVVKWITTTDHKVIGNLYFITSFIWFILAGLMALIIRAELAQPRAAGRRTTPTSTTSCSRCTARSCCCSSRRRCSPGSRTR